MTLSLLFALAAPAWAADPSDAKLHFRRSKQPKVIENLDTTIRSPTQFYALELVVSATSPLEASWGLCAAVLPPGVSEPPADATVCAPLGAGEAGAGLSSGRTLSQGLSVASVFAESGLDDDLLDGKIARETSHLRVWVEDPDGVVKLTRQATLIYDASVPVVQFDLVTHPGMYVVAGIPCESLVDAGVEAPPVCERRPFGLALSDQFSFAPAGIHLRYAPFNDLTWLGFSFDASAVVVGEAIEATGTGEKGEEAATNFQASPVSLGAGLDFQIPLGTQRLNIGVQGGVMLGPVTAETLRWNPAFMIVTSVPIATLFAR